MSGADKVAEGSKVDWTDPGQVAAAVGMGASASPSPSPAPAETPAPAVTETPSPTPSPAPAAAPSPSPTPAPAETPTPAVEEAPKGVALKDGKILPISVLQEERREKAEFKRRAAAAEGELAELKAQLEKGKRGEAVTIPDISALEGEVPQALFETMKGMQSSLVTLQKQNQDMADAMKAREEQDEQEAKDARAADYEAALDKYPLLKNAHVNQGAVYQESVAISKRLMADPEYAQGITSHAQHFADVDRELRKSLGLPEAAPAAAASPTPAPAPAPAAKPLPPKDAAAAAAPGSLSDLPGGAAPATSEGEAFMNMDGLKGAAVLAKMTPADMNAWLRRTVRA